MPARRDAEASAAGSSASGSTPSTPSGDGKVARYQEFYEEQEALEGARLRE